MRRGGAGTALVFKRPVIVGGLRNNRVESFGSTGTTLDEYGATVITATAANMVFTLPPVKPGLFKWVNVTYTGNADDFIIACNSTEEGFDGTATNTIVCTSSQEHTNFLFYGLTTAQWGVIYSPGRLTRASTAISAADYVFTASTVSSTTDVT